MKMKYCFVPSFSSPYFQGIIRALITAAGATFHLTPIADAQSSNNTRRCWHRAAATGIGWNFGPVR